MKIGDSLFKGNKNNFRTISDNVADILRNRFVRGELKFGQRLMENDIAKELGVSRTPVRSAITKLVNEGLLVYVPHRGVEVVSFDYEDVIKLYDVRIINEGLAVRLAVMNINENSIEELKNINEQLKACDSKEDLHIVSELNTQFHFSIYELSDNSWLTGIINNLWMCGSALRIRALHMSEGVKKSTDEHDEIIDALRNKNTANVELLFRRHMESAKEKILLDFDLTN